MRSLITAIQAAVLVAIAIGVAPLPAAAQTPGMSAEEYADHMNSNAQQWDDLADQAADPADAAGWRRRAAAMRAEAVRGYHQAAIDALLASETGDATGIFLASETGDATGTFGASETGTDTGIFLASETGTNAVRNAVSVAVNVGIRSVTHGVTPMAIHVAPPRAETPRSFTITAGPSHYN